MSQHTTHLPRFLRLRQLWKPVAITGTGGAAIAIWIDEILMFAEEILGLIFLPILAGVIYLLDIFIFKSRLPKREDMTNTNGRGAKK